MIWEIYEVHFGPETSRYRAVRHDEEMKKIIKEKTFNSRVEAEMYVANEETFFIEDFKMKQYEKIQDFKMKQKSLTELNYDGNEERGRYGEDESI